MNFVRYQPTAIDDVGLIHARYQDHAFKPHYHLDYHVGLIARGQQVFYSKGRKHQIGPGSIQIMMPDQVHDSQTLKEQGFATRIFSLSTDWLTALFRQQSRGVDELPVFNHCIEDDELYQQLMRLHDGLYEDQVSQLAKECMPLEYFSQLLLRHCDGKPLPVTKIGSQQLRLLRDYLMSHLAEKIHLKDLAQLCQLSEPQLLRHFKRATGMTPYAWLACLRLEHAKALLLAGKSSLQVAYEVGFYDQAHFIKAFRQAYGLTPSQIQPA